MEKIDYKKIVDDHPWILEKKQRCILSPDADGFLSGLLMTSHLGWDVIGFYDGKVLLITPNTDLSEVIFLDMEILRPNIKSIGHHMNIHNFRSDQSDITERFKNVINPNYIRGLDRCHNFTQKYPLGTVHLLMFILDASGIPVHIHPNGLGAVFFADGTWKVLFNYTKNVLDWFNYLDAKKDEGWVEELKSISVIKLLEELEGLFEQMSKIHPQKKRWYGHINLYDFESEKGMMLDFLTLLSKNLGWDFDTSHWNTENLVKIELNKKIKDASGEVGFRGVLDENPISMAMTQGALIQYTLDDKGIFK